MSSIQWWSLYFLNVDQQYSLRRHVRARRITDVDVTIETEFIGNSDVEATTQYRCSKHSCNGREISKGVRQFLKNKFWFETGGVHGVPAAALKSFQSFTSFAFLSLVLSSRVETIVHHHTIRVSPLTNLLKYLFIREIHRRASFVSIFNDQKRCRKMN